MRRRNVLTAVLFSVALILTTVAPAAAQTDYSPGGTPGAALSQTASQITLQLDSNFAVGTGYTAVVNPTFTGTVPASRIITLVTDQWYSGTVTVSGTDIYGNPIVQVFQLGANPNPAPVATAVANPTPDFGFVNGVPTTPGAGTPIAVTGSSTQLPVILGTSLLVAGGLALLAVRKRQDALTV